MTNPCARRSGIFSENLGSDTILYDKINHRAHSLNRTVAVIWESADGEKSADDLAKILQRELGVPADPSIVLLALEELAAAGLLMQPVKLQTDADAPSRRDVARKLAMAGVSAGLVPLIASVLAPTPAMASSPVTKGQALQDLNKVTVEAELDPKFYLGPNAKTAQTDLMNADSAYLHADYSSEITDLNGIIKALGLPPL
jgi:hypothetical protein